MKHNIRQRVINQFGLPVVKIEQVQGELGSRIVDKHGIEIFENDLVRTYEGLPSVETVMPVKFSAGTFMLGIRDLCEYESDELEVIGHAED